MPFLVLKGKLLAPKFKNVHFLYSEILQAILKQQEKQSMLQEQINNAQKEKENFQSEMELLLDRINKLSEMVDKSRVKP